MGFQNTFMPEAFLTGVNETSFAIVKVTSQLEVLRVLQSARVQSVNWTNDASTLKYVSNTAHSFVRIKLVNRSLGIIGSICIADLIGLLSLSPRRVLHQSTQSHKTNQSD
eukprot:131797_1